MIRCYLRAASACAWSAVSIAAAGTLVTVCVCVTYDAVRIFL